MQCGIDAVATHPSDHRSCRVNGTNSIAVAVGLTRDRASLPSIGCMKLCGECNDTLESDSVPRFPHTSTTDSIAHQIDLRMRLRR